MLLQLTLQGYLHSEQLWKMKRMPFSRSGGKTCLLSGLGNSWADLCASHCKHLGFPKHEVSWSWQKLTGWAPVTATLHNRLLRATASMQWGNSGCLPYHEHKVLCLQLRKLHVFYQLPHRCSRLRSQPLCDVKPHTLCRCQQILQQSWQTELNHCNKRLQISAT